MNARLHVLLLGLLAGGCVVPTLAELEAQQPLACNAGGNCLPGYSCVRGTCIPGEGRECLEGDERVCDTPVGECSGGTEVCGSNGRFGACDRSKVKYGPAYEPVETLCDGKDNDCDGATDEEFSRSCPLTEGVCASSVSLCVEGAWQECTPSTYLAASSDWQPHETLCDGRDNDCDGAVDGAREELVPASSMPRRPAAVQVTDGANPDVVLAWEQVDRVLFRRVNADGGLGPVRFPAVTVEKNLESWGPAFAPCGCSNCDCHVAAWFDKYACSSPSPCSRLVGGLLHSDGWTRVGAEGKPDGGVVMPLFGEENMGRGGALQLVRGGNRVAAVFTVTGASGTTVRLVTCPAALDGRCDHASLGDGDMPTVAVSGNGDLAAAAWRRDGGLVVAELPLSTMDWNAPASSRTVWDVAGSVGETEPRLLGDPQGDLRLYSVDPAPMDGGAPALVFRAALPPCAGGSCVGGLTESTARVQEIPSGTGARVPSALALRDDAPGGKDLLAYQVGSGSTSEVWMAAHSGTGWLQSPTRVPGPAAGPLWVTSDTLYLEANGAVARDLACHP